MSFDFHFQNPHMLWLALLVPVYVGPARRVTTAAVRHPSVRHLRRAAEELSAAAGRASVAAGGGRCCWDRGPGPANPGWGRGDAQPGHRHRHGADRFASMADPNGKLCTTASCSCVSILPGCV